MESPKGSPNRLHQRSPTGDSPKWGPKAGSSRETAMVGPTKCVPKWDPHMGLPHRVSPNEEPQWEFRKGCPLLGLPKDVTQEGFPKRVPQGFHGVFPKVHPTRRVELLSQYCVPPEVSPRGSPKGVFQVGPRSWIPKLFPQGGPGGLSSKGGPQCVSPMGGLEEVAQVFRKGFTQWRSPNRGSPVGIPHRNSTKGSGNVVPTIRSPRGLNCWSANSRSPSRFPEGVSFKVPQRGSS